jgi:tocopherol cyclase
MFNKIRKIYKPQVFQGSLKKRNYFEGWYNKCVDRTKTHTFVFIAGVSLGKNPDESHAFIQVIDGDKGTSDYLRYPLAEFRAAEDRFEISVGNSVISSEGIKLSLNSADTDISGELEFSGVSGWPVTLLSPGVMGPFAFMPFLECYHGVLSFNHSLKGTLVINGSPVDFSGGRGYTEKDYGKSMPRSWIWMQSNNFGEVPASLSFSVADVPFMGLSFKGFIIGFLLKGRLYKFATYNGSRILSLNTSGDAVSVKVGNSRHILAINARKSSTSALASPIAGMMKGRINESVNSSIAVTLSERTSGNIIFFGTGTNAGLEVVGY